jgi:hypothetical protein
MHRRQPTRCMHWWLGMARRRQPRQVHGRWTQNYRGSAQLSPLACWTAGQAVQLSLHTCEQPLPEQLHICTCAPLLMRSCSCPQQMMWSTGARLHWRAGCSHRGTTSKAGDAGGSCSRMATCSGGCSVLAIAHMCRRVCNSVCKDSSIL